MDKVSLSLARYFFLKDRQWCFFLFLLGMIWAWLFEIHAYEQAERERQYGYSKEINKNMLKDIVKN